SARALVVISSQGKPAPSDGDSARPLLEHRAGSRGLGRGTGHTMRETVLIYREVLLGGRRASGSPINARADVDSPLRGRGRPRKTTAALLTFWRRRAQPVPFGCLSP